MSLHSISMAVGSTPIGERGCAEPRPSLPAGYPLVGSPSHTPQSSLRPQPKKMLTQSRKETSQSGIVAQKPGAQNVTPRFRLAEAAGRYSHSSSPVRRKRNSFTASEALHSPMASSGAKQVAAREPSLTTAFHEYHG